MSITASQWSRQADGPTSTWEPKTPMMPSAADLSARGIWPMDRCAQEQLTNASDQRAFPHRVRHALTYMRANIGEKVTLAGLATACGMPERTLLNQFRKFVGLSPL